MLIGSVPTRVHKVPSQAWLGMATHSRDEPAHPGTSDPWPSTAGQGQPQAGSWAQDARDPAQGLMSTAGAHGIVYFFVLDSSSGQNCPFRLAQAAWCCCWAHMDKG